MSFLIKVPEFPYPKFHLDLVKIVFDYMYQPDEIYTYKEAQIAFTAALSKYIPPDGTNVLCCCFCNCRENSYERKFYITDDENRCLGCNLDSEILKGKDIFGKCKNKQHHLNDKLVIFLDRSCVCDLLDYVDYGNDPDYTCPVCCLLYEFSNIKLLCKECYESFNFKI